ncbi:MAG: hypothetical protein MUO85_00340 [candidate division Zixibacteria bacterium]|nr:hypothetical protein [candidate division Zixibacteria bacterium]
MNRAMCCEAKTKHKVGILGGGLTGLVLAYHLRDKEEREAVAKKVTWNRDL